MKNTHDYFLNDKKIYRNGMPVISYDRDDRICEAREAYQIDPPVDPKMDSQERWNDYLNGAEFSVEEFVETIKYHVEQASYAWDRIGSFIMYAENDYKISGEELKLIVEKTKDLLDQGRELVLDTLNDLKDIFGTEDECDVW
jgi:hypothetical protein